VRFLLVNNHCLSDPTAGVTHSLRTIVDHVLTCSQFLTDRCRDTIGPVSTPLQPPLEWSSVVARHESRAFVTFVNPSPHKGLLLFARLADMLGSRRPDIPILVLQSGHSGGSLNAIPGIDFSKWRRERGHETAEGSRVGACTTVPRNRY
jgi:hypothetical protein